MLTQEVNDRYTKVGPGTPCGELMRRYWHPIATVSQMKDRDTKPVRLLGEDLVLYKDRSGTYGLIDPFCKHRRMNMVYGIPEEKGLRCPYHGWLYDETGQCIEQPYEETEDPAARFKDKVKMKAYPVQMKAGLLFAYLGPQPAPLLPNWDVFAVEDVVRDIGYSVLDCNWLQCQENSLDPIHVEWLHQAWSNFAFEKLGRVELNRAPVVHEKIGFDRFQYGIIKRRVVRGGSEEDDDWKIGHPIVFPYFLRQGGSGTNRDWGRGRGPSFQIRVPIDDTQTAHWWVMCHKRAPEDPEQKPEDIPMFNVPVGTLDEEGRPRWEYLDNNSGQDVTAWVTQGRIADRTQETLGRSDKGIILFRQMLEENIAIVEDGGEPMNTFRDPEENVLLAMDTEAQTRFSQGGPARQRGGSATKYSAILTQREGAVKY